MKKYWLLGLGLLAATSAWGIKAPTTLEGAKLSNGTLSGAITASSATISSPTLSGTVGASAATITSPTVSGTLTATGVTISAPRSIAGASAKGDLIVQSGTAHEALNIGSYGQVLTADSSTSSGLKWAAISGGINYVSYPDAENNATTGWVTYDDGASATPVNGVDGSPTGITFGTTSGTPIRGSYSFTVTKAAADHQGEGVAYDFSIANGDQARVMSVEFAYTVASGTYTAETSTTNPDLIAYIYDVTNATLIQPAPYKIVACSTGTQCRFKGEFQTASNSTSYRLVLHQSLTGTNSYSILLDDFKVSPSIKSFGAPISDWNSFSNMTCDLTTNVTLSGFRRRVGDSEEYFVKIAFSGTNTQTGIGDITITDRTIDTSKLAQTTNGYHIVGTSAWLDASSTSYMGNVRYTSSNTVRPTYFTQPASLIEVGQAAFNSNTPFQVASGDGILLRFTIPVQGWSSSTQMSDGMGADTRVISARYQTSTTTVGTSTTTITMSSKVFDTHSAYSSGLFTVPVGGYYEVSASLYPSTAPTATAGNQVYAVVTRNGSNIATLGQFVYQVSGVALSPVINGKATVYADAGQTLGVGMFRDAGVASFAVSNDYYTAASFTKVSGPSSIAASETVAAKYTTNTATSVANTGNTLITFEDLEYDSHGAYASGIFTAPSSGLYSISAKIVFDSYAYAVSNNISIFYAKNGTSPTSRLGFTTVDTTTAGYYSVWGSSDVRLNAGDTIRIYAANNRSGGASNLLNDGSDNFFAIKRIGL